MKSKKTTNASTKNNPNIKIGTVDIKDLDAESKSARLIVSKKKKPKKRLN